MFSLKTIKAPEKAWAMSGGSSAPTVMLSAYVMAISYSWSPIILPFLRLMNSVKTCHCFQLEVWVPQTSTICWRFSSILDMLLVLKHFWLMKAKRKMLIASTFHFSSAFHCATLGREKNFYFWRMRCFNINGKKTLFNTAESCMVQ